MYRVIIKGEADTDFSDLAQLDGIDSQDNFSDYFDSDWMKEAVSGGHMYFKYEDGKLMTYTVYKSTRPLTAEELHDLADYTQGQWSDGIGEGFEQYPCAEIEGEEVYISPWQVGQKLVIIEEEV